MIHVYIGHNLEDIKETIGNLKDSFEELKKATRAATKSMRIEVLDLVDTVCSLPVTSVPADRQYLQEIVNQFHDSNSVDVVFSRLGFHWDYLHPDVYDQLIDKLQLYTYNPDLLQMVQTYRGHLDEFLEQTPLKEFCKVEKNFIVKNREHAKAVASVFFKNDWEEPVMLKQVEDLRRETALKCSLQQCAVIVFDIELGCYVPTLLVPVAAEPLIRSLDADFIRKHNVIAIIFQESVVYPQFPVGPTEQHRPQLPGQTCT